MKSLILALLLTIACTGTYAQTPVNLEQLTYKETVKHLLGNRKATHEAKELRSTLPVSVTENVNGYGYGPVWFKNKADGFNGTISFFFDPSTGQQIEGIGIDIPNTADAQKLTRYLKSKYGEAEILSPEPTVPDHGFLIGNSVCIWRNAGQGLTLVMANNYFMEGNKQAQEIKLYTLKSDLKPIDKSGYKTVADRIAASLVP